MNSKEALKLAILEYEKDLEFDENNQWVKNVLKGLKECLQGIDKFEKHREIEKELGIDLITLYKAQTQGFYIINVSNKIEKVRLSEWRFNLIKKEVHRVQWNNHLLFADYGKTWALTKGELKNENTR